MQRNRTFPRKHDTFNVHKEVKEITNKFHRPSPTILRNTTDQIIVGLEANMKRWE